MQAHRTDASVQQAACSALWRLTAYGDITNSFAIAKAGGITALIIAMRKHPGHADLQMNTCLGLPSLADIASDGHSDVLSKPGIVGTITTATRAHQSEAQLQDSLRKLGQQPIRIS